MTTQVCSIGEYVRAMTKNPMLADKLKGSEDKFSKDKDGGERTNEAIFCEGVEMNYAYWLNVSKMSTEPQDV